VIKFVCERQRERQVLRLKPKNKLLGGSARGQRGQRERGNANEEECERIDHTFPFEP